MRNLVALSACVITALSATGAFGWGCDGHGLTAAVGLQTLTEDEWSWFQPGFQAALHGTFPTYEDGDYPPNSVMSANPEAHLACEPDILRSYPEFNVYKNWHFSQSCYSTTPGKCEGPPRGVGMLQDVLPTIINNMKTAAATGTVDWKAHALNLTYLLHLVGDAHQPMHSCSMYDSGFDHDHGDSGGNDFKIMIPGTNGRYAPEKLHTFYDGIAGLSDAIKGQDVDEVAAVWMRTAPPDTAQAANVDVLHWLKVEGPASCVEAHKYQAAPRAPVQELKVLQPLSGFYVKKVRRTLKGQVVLGGVRLGNILKSIYAARKR